MSIRAEIDKTCERIINMEDASRQRAIKEGTLSELSTRKNKFLIGMGLDGMYEGNRNAPSMDLLNNLPINFMTTPRHGKSLLTSTCHVLTNIVVVNYAVIALWKYLRRPRPPSRQVNKDELDYQGKEKVIRALACENIHKKFHRDGSAGDVQASIVAFILEHGQRPQAVIRKSRRINSR
ncbi:hypothetical protein BDC45DRAFT_534865 [Circinella umbellata]|nr:hypothetical protein BDC45DRAFT_534865 [Circinella umbellata]